MIDWKGLLKDSLLKPREAGRAVLGWPFATGTYMQLAALTAAVSTIVSTLTFQPADDLPRTIITVLLGQPLLLALLQFGGAVLLAVLMTAGGRMFGGRGDFRGAIALVAWFNIVSIAIQLFFSVTSILLPPLAMLVGIFLIIWFFWALTAFTAELHGFVNGWRVFGGIFAGLFALSFLLNLVFVMAGLPPAGTVN
ncbi:Yip1 family protein [Algicella marina]|uniref:Yip1 domain-containing protein n=1 Tax=Algicella marina TaxID=2683284 RepID=A0A6P1SYW3_9RHOB|nr:Yip1 family protein [Algicella marina]QHQ34810.1 hypothetical protein GO499_06155 [Algicella marina]